MSRPTLTKEPFQYETIKFAGRLEILDREGRVALFSRRQRIRFLEDGVGIFFDRVWGDGVLFASYSTGSMRILDAIPTRKGYVVPLALPRRFRKGEIFDVQTERRIVGAFTDEVGYWDSAMQAPTQLLTIDILAPRSRTFRRPEIVGPPKGDIDAAVKQRLFSFRAIRPALDIPYKLTWSWK